MNTNLLRQRSQCAAQTSTANSADLHLHLQGTPIPAPCPAEERGIARDMVKLLVLDAQTSATRHDVFRNVSRYLGQGDLLVVNTSKTLPASLPASMCGKPLRIHLSNRITRSIYIVERRSAEGGPNEEPFAVGDRLAIGANSSAAMATVIGRFHPNSRLWYIECRSDLWKLAARVGEPIRYGYLQSKPDVNAFQTMFARDLGSAEMPSAARAFTPRVVSSLQERGVLFAEITLHTGVSSHEVAGPLAEHPFLPEWFSVPSETAELVNRTNAAGRRVVAVGTTVVRALAAATSPATGRVDARRGWTDIVITPEHPVPSVTGLITGMHESDTSHLAMLFSFVSPDKLRQAYQSALERGYLWHEFGDINLILS